MNFIFFYNSYYKLTFQDVIWKYYRPILFRVPLLYCILLPNNKCNRAKGRRRKLQIHAIRTFLMLKINFLMTSFGYIIPCPFTLLHLLPTNFQGEW